MKLRFLNNIRFPALLSTLVLLAAGSLAAQPGPTVTLIDPQPSTVVLQLVFLNITFSVAVVGVDASTLLINGTPATDVVTNDNNNYTFHFPQPPSGPVQVAWAANQAITDTTPQSNPFAGGSWGYTVDTNINIHLSISEFLANNNHGIQDEDGNHSAWIELHNADTVQASLDGWFLTTNAANLTMWQFPVGTPQLQGNGYMFLWASAKNRTNPFAPLHTDFKLSKPGNGYLALVDPNTNIVSEFNPYPAQFADVSYGRDAVDPSLVGYFSTPTPGKRNSTTGSGVVPDPIFSVDSGIFTNDSLTLTITTSNAPPGSIIRYSVKANNVGLGGAAAVSLPNTNSPVYTGPITFGTNLLIKVRVFPPAGTNLFPSQVICKNYIFLDSTDKDFTSNLPLMIMSLQGQSVPQGISSGGIRPEGTLAIINTVNGRAALNSVPEYIGPAGFEIFGQTSAGFPKPPVRIETHDSLGNDLNVSLLGLPADNDWKLRNPWDDKTLMNDFLGYELFEKMGNYSCGRRFVECFYDTGGGRLKYPDDYVGVEVLFETIKSGKNRVNIPSITSYDTNEPAITGGWIIKKDKDSNGDLNFNTAGGGGFGGQALKIHEPKVQTLRTVPSSSITSFPGSGYTPSGTNQLKYIVGFLNQMEKALYAANWLAPEVVGTTNHWSYYLDAASWVDFHWLMEFTKQIDGYRLSDYFHKDRSGKITAGPVWDMNLSFGNADYLDGGHSSGWYYEELSDTDHIWLRRLITGTTSGNTSSGDPDFTQKITDRWSVLRTNILNGTNILHRIDDISSMLNEAAQRDTWGPKGKYRASLVGLYTWPTPPGPPAWDVDYVHPLNYLGNDTNSIIFQMKKWTLGRFLWIDNQFTPTPTLNASDGLVASGSTVTITPPPGARLYYTLDGTDPRLPGGTAQPGAFSSNGPAVVTVSSNVRIVARAKAPTGWKNTFSGPAAVTLVTALPSLRITEIMYNPPPPPVGSPYTTNDFEYIEVKNIGGAPLSVNQFILGGGVQFVFPNIVLSAGQSAVVVANINAFQSRYGASALILGAYTGHLNNGGDHLTLTGSLQEPIQNFSYDNNWYPATDGDGFSLVAVANPTNGGNSAGDWRPSSTLNGSPGLDDPIAPPRPPVLVNEVLSNETAPAVDAIELYNPTAGSVDVSGWFLSDRLNTPQKYTIPPGTPGIPAGAYIVFYATNSFGANGTNSFGFGATGDHAYLFSGDGVNLTGYAHGVNFGAAASDVAFGRYVTSVGEEHFVAQAFETLGGPNAGPLVGPIVITEFNYHPPEIAVNGIGYDDTMDEFIELKNISSNPVPLYDPTFPTNTWRLTPNAVGYEFPSGVVLQPNGFLLVVSFDPAANPAATASFRSRNFVPDSVPLYGPWQRTLNNFGAKIELVRPDAPATNGTVPFILVDRVEYSNVSPWAQGADGFGLTLQRIVNYRYGDDPTNWVASAAAPGADYIPGGTPPAITSQPGDRLIVAGTDALLSASATGTAPIRYQWRYNGLNIYGANGSTLLLTNFQFSQSGSYTIFIYNSGGYVISTNFTLTARTGLKITSQPINRVATNGATTNFTLSAVGTGTLRYQWRFNGVNIPNATNSSATNPGLSILILANVSIASQGTYDCLVSADYDPTIVSQPATLTIVYKPVYALMPQSTTIGVVGQSVSSSLSVTGTPPMTYLWRKLGVGILNPGAFSGYIVSTPTYSSLILTNLTTSNAGTYFAVVTNIVGLALGGGASGVSYSNVLTVLADTDLDGLPDVFQAAHPGVVGAGDEDHDGMSNAAEYFAGTDPFNPASNLKLSATAGPGTLQFSAVSNRTYTVQYTDHLGSGPWKKLADVLASNVTRIESVTDSNPRTNRLYRIVIPIQP